MAPTRPEFFYHPVVGVVSPTSLGLFAFKPGPLVVTNPPKVLNRVTAPPAAAPELPGSSIMETASPVAIAAKIAPEPDKETDMKKQSSANLGLEKCIVTSEELPIEKMLRFVADPDNTIVVDINEKLPGKGFWLKADRDVIKKALWRNSFTTANRAPVNVPKNLLETVQLGLLRQSMETLGLAKKAGLVTQGFAKVEDVLKEGRTALYIVASDAKENGREKLERLAKNKGSIPVLDVWTASQLSAALGIDNAIHIVLTAGSLTEKLMNIAHKLKDVR